MIGRVLGDWLARHGVTPFELLHRADLAEQLEACAAELSAAVQAATALDGAERGGAEQSTREALGRLARRATPRNLPKSRVRKLTMRSPSRNGQVWRTKDSLT